MMYSGGSKKKKKEKKRSREEVELDMEPLQTAIQISQL